MFEKLDFGRGVITYNDFHIETELSFKEEDDLLKEDMFQVEYPNNYVIDVGWYSGVKKFIIFIIKDYNWEEPILKNFYSNLNSLDAGMEECISMVNQLINK